MQHLPANATVVGRWTDIVGLEYLQIVEGQRYDLHLYNLFYIDDIDFVAYLLKRPFDANPSRNPQP